MYHMVLKMGMQNILLVLKNGYAKQPNRSPCVHCTALHALTPTHLLPFSYAHTGRPVVWGAKEEPLNPPLMPERVHSCFPSGIHRPKLELSHPLELVTRPQPPGYPNHTGQTESAETAEEGDTVLHKGRRK